VDAYNGTGEPDWNTAIGRGWYFANALTTDGYGAFVVPTDFVSGMTATAVIVDSGGGGGNFWLGSDASYSADTEAWNTNTATFADAAVAAPANGIIGEVCQMALAGIAVGDSVELEFKRTGGHGSDTSTDGLIFMGWIIEYTADS